MRRLKCAEIWGGIKNADIDVCSSGMTVSLYSSACDGVRGGDAYYFSVCGADRVTRVVLADVVGHGEQISEVSQWVYDELSAHLDDPDLPGMLSSLNGRVLTRGIGAMTTAVVISYYVDLKQVYFCYAGHPPMLIRHGADGWQKAKLKMTEGETNLPLGVSDGVGYDMSDIQLAPGDNLLLISDGVVEAPNADHELFGDGRLRAALAEVDDPDPMQLKARILARLREWTGGGLDHDDVTLIAIKLS